MQDRRTMCSSLALFGVFLLTLNVVVFASSLRVDTAATTHAIEVQFHLSSAAYTEQEVEELFTQRTSPDSPSFRQHLSQEELINVVAASDATVNAVVSFAERHGATDIHVFATRDVVSCRLSLASRYTAFGLAASDFVPSTDGNGFRRVLDVELVRLGVPPRSLYSILATAAGRDTLDARLKMKPLADQQQVFNHTPDDLRGRYSIPKTPAKAPANFTSGTGQFCGQSFFMSNVETFSKHFDLPEPEVIVNGANPVNSSSGVGSHAEGTMDVEIITALSGGVNTHWIGQNISSNSGPYNMDFSLWVEQLLAIPNPPSAVSVSYGAGYNEYNITHNNMAMLEADNRAFRKVALRGISLFASSGDSGPTYPTYGNCNKFMPVWPASSPYVTSVGGTTTSSTHGPESAWSFSGGGFSTVFPAPSYQKDVVSKYLANPNVPSTSFFDKTGRAYPDVAALASNVLVYLPMFQPTPVWFLGGGTSSAAPMWAAVITRLNLERQRQGKPNVGFLNPTLYKLGHVGQDITTGASICGSTTCYNVAGFPAAEGWDAVTGFGTPDFEFLLKNL